MNEPNTASGGSQPASLWSSIERMRKRRKYINNRTLQVQIVKHLIVIALIGGILALNSFYIYNSLVPYHEPDATLLEFSSSNMLIWGYALLSLTMNGVLFLIVAVFYSHRLIGPHEKIVAALQQMAEGDLQRRIRLRNTDHLQEIAHAVNQVVSSYSGSIGELNQTLLALKDHHNLDDQEIDRRLAAMEATLNRYTLAGNEVGNEAR